MVLNGCDLRSRKKWYAHFRECGTSVFWPRELSRSPRHSRLEPQLRRKEGAELPNKRQIWRALITEWTILKELQLQIFCARYK